MVGVSAAQFNSTITTMSSPKSASYRKGLKNAKGAHYWAHRFNSDIDGLPTLAEKVDFYNGYHDGLADKYNMARPAHTPVEGADRFALYVY